ncbi:multimeric flavodoxin WrbA [Lachnotalea glycerini]|uniref:Flavodoxin family protein n=1 Tax=Lachnotalea glycerini TaxID=1763509 RepID=A0A318EUC0_9FIRM|nr:flavodoxin family protein [Lachnotalea glycerini]PXV95842.1 multimeric flavodoxin WrbA [Lachnotalea glycerini]RDY33100.1 flavodoxin family protein [Lachnotalea glycerini]
MKVLLINGSPNKEKCTYTALKEVADQLNKNDIETEIFHIGNKPVRGCIGCGKCSSNQNRCVFNDDTVNEAIALMEEADGLIIGSPVYYASANGSLISFLDRMYYAGKTCFAYKPGAAIVSARRAGTTASLDELNKYFTIAKMPVVSSHYWNMVHGNTPQEVKKDLEGMQILRALADNMAWLLKSIEAGKKAGITLPESETRVRTSYIR